MFCKQNFQVEPLCEGPGTLKQTLETTDDIGQKFTGTRVDRQFIRRSWSRSINEPWLDSLLRSYVFAIG